MNPADQKIIEREQDFSDMVIRCTACNGSGGQCNECSICQGRGTLPLFIFDKEE